MYITYVYKHKRIHLLYIIYNIIYFQRLNKGLCIAANILYIA